MTNHNTTGAAKQEPQTYSKECTVHIHSQQKPQKNMFRIEECCKISKILWSWCWYFYVNWACAVMVGFDDSYIAIFHWLFSMCSKGYFYQAMIQHCVIRLQYVYSIFVVPFVLEHVNIYLSHCQTNWPVLIFIIDKLRRLLKANLKCNMSYVWIWKKMCVALQIR